MVNRQFTKGAKKTLGHRNVSWAVHISRRMCNIDLNKIFLDCLALFKCKLSILQKSFTSTITNDIDLKSSNTAKQSKVKRFPSKFLEKAEREV